MPSFDVVSKIDNHEVTNAVDQANREITTRFDFRGSDARIELVKDTVTLIAPTDFQLKQLDEIFQNKLAKRQVDSRSLEYKNPEIKIRPMDTAGSKIIFSIFPVISVPPV